MSRPGGNMTRIRTGLRPSHIHIGRNLEMMNPLSVANNIVRTLHTPRSMLGKYPGRMTQGSRADTRPTQDVVEHHRANLLREVGNSGYVTQDALTEVSRDAQATARYFARTADNRADCPPHKRRRIVTNAVQDGAAQTRMADRFLESATREQIGHAAQQREHLTEVVSRSVDYGRRHPDQGNIRETVRAPYLNRPSEDMTQADGRMLTNQGDGERDVPTIPYRSFIAPHGGTGLPAMGHQNDSLSGRYNPKRRQAMVSASNTTEGFAAITAGGEDGSVGLFQGGSKLRPTIGLVGQKRPRDAPVIPSVDSAVRMPESVVQPAMGERQSLVNTSGVAAQRIGWRAPNVGVQSVPILPHGAAATDELRAMTAGAAHGLPHRVLPDHRVAAPSIVNHSEPWVAGEHHHATRPLPGAGGGLGGGIMGWFGRRTQPDISVSTTVPDAVTLTTARDNRGVAVNPWHPVSQMRLLRPSVAVDTNEHYTNVAQDTNLARFAGVAEGLAGSGLPTGPSRRQPWVSATGTVRLPEQGAALGGHGHTNLSLAMPTQSGTPGGYIRPPPVSYRGDDGATQLSRLWTEDSRPQSRENIGWQNGPIHRPGGVSVTPSPLPTESSFGLQVPARDTWPGLEHPSHSGGYAGGTRRVSVSSHDLSRTGQPADARIGTIEEHGVSALGNGRAHRRPPTSVVATDEGGAAPFDVQVRTTRQGEVETGQTDGAHRPRAEWRSDRLGVPAGAARRLVGVV